VQGVVLRLTQSQLVERCHVGALDVPVDGADAHDRALHLRVESLEGGLPTLDVVVHPVLVLLPRHGSSLPDLHTV
jgi:hypothetical protein